MAKSFASHSLRGNVRKVSLVTVNDKFHKIQFSVPHEVRYYDKDAKEWKTRSTTWYNCAIWGSPENGWFQRAVREIQEGVYIVIDSAEYSVSTFEKKDGSKGSSHEFKVNSFYVVGGGEDADVTSTGKGQGAGRRDVGSNASSGEGDDLPF